MLLTFHHFPTPSHAYQNQASRDCSLSGHFVYVSNLLILPLHCPSEDDLSAVSPVYCPTRSMNAMGGIVNVSVEIYLGVEVFFFEFRLPDSQSSSYLRSAQLTMTLSSF